MYQFLDLVVANYGLTPAYHVKLDLTPILDWDSHFDTINVSDKPDEPAKAVAEKLSEMGPGQAGFVAPQNQDPCRRPRRMATMRA